VNVGLSTSLVIGLNKVFPGLGDLYLGKTGYESQQYDGAVSPDRQDNLWAPVPGDHGAHGEFDSRAYSWSPQLWLTKNRIWVGALAGLAAAGLLLTWQRAGENR